MGNGCCCCCSKKKVVPTPVTITTQAITPTIEPKEKPYGYIKQHAGVKTTENNYSSPIISLHTYTKSQNVIAKTKTVLNGTPSSAPSNSTTTDRQEIAEKVRCIPVEDVVSVTYSTDVKKEFQKFESTQERARAPKAKLGCCGRVKKSLRETFFCCSCCPCAICKPVPIEGPVYDTTTRKNTTAQRMILIEMKCIRYTNIHIPSHVKILPDDEKIKFYKENFSLDTIEFYLVNNNETDGNNFDARRNEAEEFMRTVVQIRTMADNYPSETQLDKILKQQKAALFGQELRD